jgi:hypothetical protein
MWYAVIDGEIWIQTKAKSQKVKNLERDNRASLLIEGGLTVATLRGVAFEGTAEISARSSDLWRVGVSVYERYTGPFNLAAVPVVEALVRKRVAVRILPERARSWDHRKLGGPEQGIAGSTARFVTAARSMTT